MVRRVHNYADGGKVVKDHDAPPPKPVTPVVKKIKPEVLGTGGAAKAADTLANRRKKQMEDLGL
jgi:hypothetical protein